MGMSPDGILAYGFDLDGAEDIQWKISGVEKWEPWRPSWLAAEQDFGQQNFDYRAAIKERLAEQGVQGVEVVEYGRLDTLDGRGIVLAAWHMESTGGGTLSVNLEDVQARRNIERWDERLLQAIKALDIVPTQPHPLFLLTQDYG